jgi:hypothetical protein
MAEVLPFPRHKLHGAWCCQKRGESCFICDGGLGVCHRCFGGEASLPSECPGRPLTPQEHADVASGFLDFRDGEWHRIPSSLTHGA